MLSPPPPLCVGAAPCEQVLSMLESYWTKAMVNIMQIVIVEATFVADAQKRKNQLGVRGAESPQKM